MKSIFNRHPMRSISVPRVESVIPIRKQFAIHVEKSQIKVSLGRVTHRMRVAPYQLNEIMKFVCISLIQYFLTLIELTTPPKQKKNTCSLLSGFSVANCQNLLQLVFKKKDTLYMQDLILLQYFKYGFVGLCIGSCEQKYQTFNLCYFWTFFWCHLHNRHYTLMTYTKVFK